MADSVCTRRSVILMLQEPSLRDIGLATSILMIDKRLCPGTAKAERASFCLLALQSQMLPYHRGKRLLGQ